MVGAVACAVSHNRTTLEYCTVQIVVGTGFGGMPCACNQRDAAFPNRCLKNRTSWTSAGTFFKYQKPAIPPELYPLATPPVVGPGDKAGEAEGQAIRLSAR